MSSTHFQGQFAILVLVLHLMRSGVVLNLYYCINIYVAFIFK